MTTFLTTTTVFCWYAGPVTKGTIYYFSHSDLGSGHKKLFRYYMSTIYIYIYRNFHKDMFTHLFEFFSKTNKGRGTSSVGINEFNKPVHF